MSNSLYAVYGASGCGRGVMPLAREQWRRQGLAGSLVFIDDGHPDTLVNGHPVLRFDNFLTLDATDRYAVLAIADSMIREQLAAQCAAAGIKPWTVMADNVVIMDNVQLGQGAILSPFVTLTSNISIGCHFHANLYSYVEHDCVIGDFVTFAPRVCCNGNVIIEDHVYIGTGAMIRQGRPGRPLTIGQGAVVGMGAVVTKDVSPGVVVVGNPAKLLIKK